MAVSRVVAAITAVTIISVILAGIFLVWEFKAPTKPTEMPSQEQAKVYGKKILESGIPPSSLFIDLPWLAGMGLYPALHYTWPMIKYNESNTLSTPSEVPRKPVIVYRQNISANMGGYLATPLVDQGVTILADERGVYALDMWGAEIYSDDTTGRDMAIKWKAYGFYRFIHTYSHSTYGILVGTSASVQEETVYILLVDRYSGELKQFAKHTGLRANTILPIRVNDTYLVVEGYVFPDYSSRLACYAQSLTEFEGWGWDIPIDNEKGFVNSIVLGNNAIYVSIVDSKNIYAFTLKGKILWKYSHPHSVGSLAYKNGKLYFGDIVGNLVAISESGEKIWERKIGVGVDVRGNSLLALGNSYIYISVTLGENKKLIALDYSGNVVSEFILPKGERPGLPVATKNVILLPTVSSDYAKVYILWRGLEKLDEVAIKAEEPFMPTISVAHGDILAVFAYDRASQVLVKLSDTGPPVVENITQTKTSIGLDIRATIYDNRSAIYKAILAYKPQNSSIWHYIEMETEKRYVIEPVGRYGFGYEEVYIGTILGQPEDYAIIAMDSVGNFLIVSKDGAIIRSYIAHS